jgi:hypothetical protein
VRVTVEGLTTAWTVCLVCLRTLTVGSAGLFLAARYLLEGAAGGGYVILAGVQWDDW